MIWLFNSSFSQIVRTNFKRLFNYNAPLESNNAIDYNMTTAENASYRIALETAFSEIKVVSTFRRASRVPTGRNFPSSEQQTASRFGARSCVKRMPQKESLRGCVIALRTLSYCFPVCFSCISCREELLYLNAKREEEEHGGETKRKEEENLHVHCRNPSFTLSRKMTLQNDRKLLQQYESTIEELGEGRWRLRKDKAEERLDV